MDQLQKLVLVLAFLSVSLGGNGVGAQMNHVVGGDRGWNLASGIGSWSSDRIFSVGDTLWFTYSAEHESIAELKSKEEFESCDVTNPVKMYTNGIDPIALEEHGTRYFVSSKTDRCKLGLRLLVNVHLPRSIKLETQTVDVHSFDTQTIASSQIVALTGGPDADSPADSPNGDDPAESPSSD